MMTGNVISEAVALMNVVLSKAETMFVIGI
jgi:hypothetical protein